MKEGVFYAQQNNLVFLRDISAWCHRVYTFNVRPSSLTLRVANLCHMVE